MIQSGIEVLKKDPPSSLKDKKIGLLCNQASIDSSYNYSWQIINSLYKNSLKAIFSPQHGFFAQKQDNMKENSDIMLDELKIPVYSLYSNTRMPEKKQLSNIDCLVVDIQDVGCRVYTFIWTIYLCMKACNEFGKSMVILDRPNPINGEQIEGTMLDTRYESFVGMLPIPMRHGMTVGELALYFKFLTKLDNLDLKIIKMQGWKRNMYFDDTGLPWVFPSPNMPNLNAAIVYPGQVIFEGANISEGRGTTLPFELFGAPFIDCNFISGEIEKIPELSEIILRRQDFEPTFNKFHGELCRGFQIHVTDRKKYNSYLTSLYLLYLIKKFHPQDFSWKQPPYEYEFNKLPIEIIFADKTLFEMMDGRQDIDFYSLSAYLNRDVAEFKEIRENYLLYQ
jgi:uncharacterized protein YbbC (DUF1343 family)